MRLSVILTIAATALSLAGCSSDSGNNGNDTNEPADTAGHTDEDTPDTGGQDESSPTDTKPEPDESTNVDVTPDNSVEPDLPQKPDVYETGVSAKGYGEFCITGADCGEYGLSCFRYGPEDVDAICSRMCETDAQCPKFFVCDYKFGYEDPLKICMAPVFCSECHDDIQCKTSGLTCVPDGQGRKYCTEPCEPGVPSCRGGAACAYMEEQAGWFCKPLYGTCWGDGTSCSPCQIDTDCKAGSYCELSYYTKERFCSKECNDSSQCPDNMGCFDIGGPTGQCFPVFENQYAPTCYVGSQGFCHECRGHYDCEPGHICFVGPGNTGFYCTPECSTSDTCPEFTHCKGSFSIEGTGVDRWGCKVDPAFSCLDILTILQNSDQ